MSDIKLNQYYNLFNATKGYTELLFRSGKVLQSQELNEMQRMLKNQIKNVGNTILTNGDTIEGCQLVFNENNEVIVTKGKVYLEGDVRTLNDTRLTIKGKGTEVIGIKLTKEIISPSEDKDLLDISTGYDNYNQDGAYRLKETVQITLDDPTASILYTLVDGHQLSKNNVEDLTQLDKMQVTLARRTFDESGNYKVNGLELLSKKFFDDEHIFISMEPGKAYVRGYEVNVTVAQTISLDRPVSTRQVTNEPKVYRTGTKKYALNNDYANAINKVVAIIKATNNIVRGAIVGGTDYLPLTPVVEVIEVKQGGTTYRLGTDFQLTSDGIDWSVGTRAPSPGTSYSVTWTYNKNMVKDADYRLVKPTKDTNTGYIEFLGSDEPIDGSTFLVDYSFQLCRRDIISINKNGQVLISQGQPDVLRTVESPSVSEDSALVLGSVLLKPNTDDVVVFNNNTKNITMLALYKMLERISALEYNQAITDLDKQAAANETATELIGVFTDGFLGLSKADVYHSEWSASVDLDNHELTLPFQQSLFNLKVSGDPATRVGKFNRLMTLPYTEIQLFTQPLATGNMRVNSYNAFPKSPSVKLIPEIDNWIDSEYMEVENSKTVATSVRRWWYHKNESWAEEEKKLWQSYGATNKTANSTENSSSSSSSTDISNSGWWRTTTTTTNTTNVSTTVLDSAVLYMRTTEVEVSVENMAPNADNIVATFDGKPVTLVASVPKYQGTKPNTLKADSKGCVKGKFTIPTKTLCGTRELKIWAGNTPSLTGAASYTSNGRTLSVTKKVWTSQSVARRTVNTDPLAQSFQFANDQYLTGVGFYFLDKNSVEPITVQVRNMVNGYPGTTCYAEVVVQPELCVTSTDASRETLVKFSDPVYCTAGEQYCFTILSNSDVDSVWIAETAKIDMASGTQVSKNPYLDGQLFSSSNAITWTAHQSMDLKFNLYGAKFNTTGQAIFEQVTASSIDRLLVISEEDIPTGCSISWKYSINGGSWMPIETYVDRELDILADTIDLKVSLQGTTTTSPAIALDGLMIVGFKNLGTGTYVSKNVGVSDGYNKVKVVVDLDIPINTNVNLYYATDIEGKVWKALNNTATVPKSGSYKTYTFEASVGSTAKNYRVKVVLSSTNHLSRPKAKNLRSIIKNV